MIVNEFRGNGSQDIRLSCRKVTNRCPEDAERSKKMIIETGGNRSEIIVLAQPVGLRGQVTVQDVALLVLEAPRDHDEDISLADPCPLLDLALDPAHALDTVHAADTDVVGSHHQLGTGKLFAQFLLRQAHADYGRTVRIEFSRCLFTRFFSMKSNYNNSGCLKERRIA